MSINVHIERLVLDGLPLTSRQGATVQAAFEVELHRLLETRGIVGLAGGSVPRLDVPSIEFAPGGQPRQWGRQIARALYGALVPAPGKETLSSRPPATAAAPKLPRSAGNVHGKTNPHGGK